VGSSSTRRIAVERPDGSCILASFISSLPHSLA
jgi:hypothetical protein